MRELSLHLLDIVENSVAAGACEILVSVREDSQADHLTLSVSDNGRGMDERTAAEVVDPFFTTRTTRKVGLGIPLLKAAAEACDGYLSIQSQPGSGTCIEVTFRRSHIDRMPLGDLPTTILNLLVAYPQVRWIFSCQKDQETFYLDSQPIVDELAGVPLSEPVVLSFLHDLIQQGIIPLQLDDHPVINLS